MSNSVLVAFAVSLVTLQGYAQLAIVDVSTNSLVFASTETNVYAQVQFRFDLKQTSEFPLALETWHTFPTAGDGLVRSFTNTVELANPALAQILSWNGSVYLRVVADQNEIPTTSVRFELIVQNGSDSTVLNLHAVFAGAQEDYVVEELAPQASTERLVFNLSDGSIGCDLCIEIRGVYSLEYEINGHQRYYSFRPDGQQYMVTVDGTETGLKR
jgi:hypothetical protein